MHPDALFALSILLQIGGVVLTGVGIITAHRRHGEWPPRWWVIARSQGRALGRQLLRPYHWVRVHIFRRKPKTVYASGVIKMVATSWAVASARAGLPPLRGHRSTRKRLAELADRDNNLVSSINRVNDELDEHVKKLTAMQDELRQSLEEVNRQQTERLDSAILGDTKLQSVGLTLTSAGILVSALLR